MSIFGIPVVEDSSVDKDGVFIMRRRTKMSLKFTGWVCGDSSVPIWFAICPCCDWHQVGTYVEMYDETDKHLATNHPGPLPAEAMCPDCNGQGETWWMAYDGREHPQGPCSTCSGTGLSPAYRHLAPEAGS